MLRSTLALSLVTACAAASGAGVDGAVPVATDRVIVRVASQRAWPDLKADLESAGARLEAIPFARFTVECQSQLEKQSKAARVRQSVTSLFGLTDDEAREGEEEEPVAETKE